MLPVETGGERRGMSAALEGMRSRMAVAAGWPTSARRQATKARESRIPRLQEI